MNETKSYRNYLIAGFLALAAALSLYGPIPSGSAGASPVGRRAPFELVVTLKTDDLPRPFEHTISLTRSQYEDVRFSPQKAKKKALKQAHEALSKKLGLSRLGRGTAKLTNATVVDVVLVDTKKESRRGGRISILRNNTVS